MPNYTLAYWKKTKEEGWHRVEKVLSLKDLPKMLIPAESIYTVTLEEVGDAVFSAETG